MTAPKQEQSCLAVIGGCSASIGLIFLRSGFKPFGVSQYPSQSVSRTSHSHFKGLTALLLDCRIFFKILPLIILDKTFYLCTRSIRETWRITSPKILWSHTTVGVMWNTQKGDWSKTSHGIIHEVTPIALFNFLTKCNKVDKMKIVRVSKTMYSVK